MKQDDLWHTAFGVAYRILGQPWQAEDIAQSAMEKWLQRKAKIVNAPAYIARIAANLSLNKLRDDTRLRKKHEQFGLPLPVSYQHAADVGLDLSYGITTLLLKLPPLMRAVFILRNAFDMPFDEISTALECTNAACRQAYSRANRRLKDDPTQAMKPMADKAVLSKIVHLIQQGDAQDLAAFLSRDIVLVSDGGMTAPAFGKVIDGRERIARFLVGSPQLLGSNLRPSFGATPSGEFLMLHEDTHLKLIVLAEISDAKVSKLYTLSDLDKLDQFNWKI